MADPQTLLSDRLGEPWLLGTNPAQFRGWVMQAQQDLQPWLQGDDHPKILLVDRDPVRFLARFWVACASHCSIFLGNPDWGRQEWQQVEVLVQPDFVWGEIPVQSQLGKLDRKIGDRAQPGWIMIPTGGSSGQIRFAIHTWQTLSASVAGFQTYFQASPVNSCCVLPLYHVSGLMQFLRSLMSGGKLAIAPSRSLTPDALPIPDPQNFFISLVPTQLQRLLADSTLTAWLAQFQTVLLGGAPAWPTLLETACQAQIRVALTYGMTETASQIVALRPEDFLQGHRSSGQPLPHAQITITDPTGQPLAVNQMGQITIQAQSLALGYYPNLFPLPHLFQPDDLGYLDAQGYLQITGRNSQKIITGGENVFPAEVEAAILATQLVKDVCVLGVPDSEWGDRIVAVYVPVQDHLSESTLKSALQPHLTRYKQPKHWIAVEQLPRNLQGKTNLLKVRELMEAKLQP